MELSKTEFKVSAYVGSGYDVKEIAVAMNRSYHTAASHIKAIRVRNGLKNLAEITREFVLEFGDPRQYIVMFFLLLQIGIIYDDFGADMRRVKRGRRIVKVKTTRKNNG
ncbi:helix-turn-helix transcriptional regulator [Flavicella sediminum]|uniref:helix-turn-helix transcriptional regulator n=1 Tax=Flavicella sediminum TaxID=2585141 RepID=UPI00140C7B74|nr:LuxR C-terminal-related transcriptional regulator [Flavicella sediminum]